MKGVVDGFACPLLHCGKVFKKSGDLSLHFMTEVGQLLMLDGEEAVPVSEVRPFILSEN